MMAQTTTSLTESDRQINDLMESVRHYRTHPEVSEQAKKDAAEDLKPVYEKIAKLQDPNGFSTHLAETISQAYRARTRGERKKPLCRCELPSATCPVKRGEIPPKIRTRDYEYVRSADARELARQYLESHAADVVVREALDSFRNLRSDIYRDLNAIITDLMADANADADQDASDSASAGADGAEVAGPVLDPTEDNADAVAPAVSADGGEREPDAPAEGSVEDTVDQALADALASADLDELAADAVDGLTSTAEVLTAIRDGELDVADLPDGVRERVEQNTEN